MYHYLDEHHDNGSIYLSNRIYYFDQNSYILLFKQQIHFKIRLNVRLF